MRFSARLGERTCKIDVCSSVCVVWMADKRRGGRGVWKEKKISERISVLSKGKRTPSKRSLSTPTHLPDERIRRGIYASEKSCSRRPCGVARELFEPFCKCIGASRLCTWMKKSNETIMVEQISLIYHSSKEYPHLISIVLLERSS